MHAFVKDGNDQWLGPFDPSYYYATMRKLGLNPCVVSGGVTHNFNPNDMIEYQKIWNWSAFLDPDRLIQLAYAEQIWLKRASGVLIVRLGG